MGTMVTMDNDGKIIIAGTIYIHVLTSRWRWRLWLLYSHDDDKKQYKNKWSFQMDPALYSAFADYLRPENTLTWRLWKRKNEAGNEAEKHGAKGSRTTDVDGCAVAGGNAPEVKEERWWERRRIMWSIMWYLVIILSFGYLLRVGLCMGCVEVVVVYIGVLLLFYVLQSYS